LLMEIYNKGGCCRITATAPLQFDAKIKQLISSYVLRIFFMIGYRHKELSGKGRIKIFAAFYGLYYDRVMDFLKLCFFTGSSLENAK